ncbi:MAG: cytochrome c3 family protein [Planctomycetes bacterium]|nr:cytochrome c3 family protein [Planctomycetota bacterium]
MSLFQFPRWTDKLRPLLGATLLLAPAYVTALFYFGASPETLAVGYAPEQPIPFSHALHAGELGMDCRYCHTTVEEAAHAAIPPTSACLNCHDRILPESPLLAPLRQSKLTGDPVPWVRVHDLPDYVYFDHSAHVLSGVSCVECHGRVDRMDLVKQVESLSMGWCLDCHRDPEPSRRPREFVTQLDWKAPKDLSPADLPARRLNLDENGLDPMEDCSTCHR